MRKICTLVCAAFLCLTASARTLTFYLGDTPIQPGSEIEFNDIDIETYDDGFREVAMEPDLYLGTDMYSSKINVTVTCTSGQSIMFCGFDGNCMTGTKVEKKATIKTNAREALRFDFKGEFEAGEEIPVVTTLFEAQDGDKVETHTQFVLTMCEKGASVTAIELPEGMEVLPGEITYDLAAPAQFSLISLNGAKVIETTLSGNGSVSTAALAKGVYVYRLGNKSGKLFIK